MYFLTLCADSVGFCFEIGGKCGLTAARIQVIARRETGSQMAWCGFDAQRGWPYAQSGIETKGKVAISGQQGVFLAHDEDRNSDSSRNCGYPIPSGAQPLLASSLEYAGLETCDLKAPKSHSFDVPLGHLWPKAIKRGWYISICQRLVAIKPASEQPRHARDGLAPSSV